MMTASRSSQRSNDVSSINATMQPDIIARQLRDQSFPEPGASTAQPFTTFSCRGAVITTAGPSSSSSPRCGSPVAMPGDIAPTRDSSSAFSPQPHSPLTAGTLSFPASDVSAAADASSRSVHQVPDAPAVKTPDESKHSQQQPYSAAVPGGKRAAAQQLQAVDSMAATAAGGSSHLLSKRQVLDHYQPQQQQEQQQQQADQDMQDVEAHIMRQQAQQQQQQALRATSSLQSPFYALTAPLQQANSVVQQQQQQQGQSELASVVSSRNAMTGSGSSAIHNAQVDLDSIAPGLADPHPTAAISIGSGTAGNHSAAVNSNSGAAAAAGEMPPPSSSGSRKRLQVNLKADLSSAATAAAAGTGGPIAHNLANSEFHQQEFAGLELSLKGLVDEIVGDIDSTVLLACRNSLSSAASLEGWLPGSAAAAAFAAAVAEGQPAVAAAAAAVATAAAQGSPKSPAAAAAAANAASVAALVHASNGSISRQGSLVFPAMLVQQQQGVAATSSSTGSGLVRAGSFAGWPITGNAAKNSGSIAVHAGGGISNQQLPSQNSAGFQQHGSALNPQGSVGLNLQGSGSQLRSQASFSWPHVPVLRTVSSDSLQLDIQVLSPVVPEEYPEPKPAEQQHEQQRHQQQQLQHEQVDKAFFAKIAAWERELVGMLEHQQAPLAIKHIVAVFKDRINTERDKSEFKALCDKWTNVVEYPVGSGVKCLAIKGWMRGSGVSGNYGADDVDQDNHGTDNAA